MKLLEKQASVFVFGMSPKEGELLKLMLQLYPIRCHDSKAGFSSNCPDHSPDPEALKEALSALRSENQSRCREFLNRHETFEEKDGTVLFRLKKEDIEWFLQTVNEIRVGAWYEQGCPEEGANPQRLTDPENGHFILMELLSGVVLDLVLEAVESP